MESNFSNSRGLYNSAFCTSGGSGVGSSATNLEALTDGATWLSSTRLNGGSSRETIVDWVNSLELDIKAE